MAIDFHDVFGLLAEAIPGFEPSAVDWLEPLSYIFLSQMVDHVCVREDDSERTLLANLLEKLLTEGDDETRYLAMDGIETLAEKPEGPAVARRFGPKALEVWNSYYRPQSA